MTGVFTPVSPSGRWKFPTGMAILRAMAAKCQNWLQNELKNRPKNEMPNREKR